MPLNLYQVLDVWISFFYLSRFCCSSVCSFRHKAIELYSRPFSPNWICRLYTRLTTEGQWFIWHDKGKRKLSCSILGESKANNFTKQKYGEYRQRSVKALAISILIITSTCQVLLQFSFHSLTCVFSLSLALSLYLLLFIYYVQIEEELVKTLRWEMPRKIN